MAARAAGVGWEAVMGRRGAGAAGRAAWEGTGEGGRGAVGRTGRAEGEAVLQERVERDRGAAVGGRGGEVVVPQGTRACVGKWASWEVRMPAARWARWLRSSVRVLPVAGNRWGRRRVRQEGRRQG